MPVAPSILMKRPRTRGRQPFHRELGLVMLCLALLLAACQPAPPAAPAKPDAKPTAAATLAPSKPGETAKPSAGASPAAAASPASPVPAASPAAASKPAAAVAAITKDTLTIAQSVDPPKLDPYSTTAPYMNVHQQILEQLMYWDVDADGRPVMKNHLATEWKWTNDTTIQIKLRSGVTFSNGEPFDATSAKLSMEQLFIAVDYSQWLKDLLKEVQIVDPSTINIVLNKPAAYVPSVLAIGSFVVPPKDFAARGADTFNTAPIGTGPWVFKSHVKDSAITLEANPTYWGGTPTIKKIVYRIIPDDAARVAALEAGEVDIAMLLPLTAAQRIQANANVGLRSVSGLRQFVTMFETRTPAGAPLKDVRVRRALNYAVDKVALCKNLFAGYCRPLPGQWLSAGQTGSNPNLEVIPFDAAKAKSLLAEAGYASGLELDITYTVGRYPQDKQAGEAVSSYLRAIGVKVTEKGVEFPEFSRIFGANGMTPLFQWGVLYSQDGYLAMLPFAKGSRFRTSEMPQSFDDLMEKAAVTTDDAARLKLLQDANQALNQEPFGLYLYTLDDLYGVKKEMGAIPVRADQTIKVAAFGVAAR
ncbi:MAG: ABC transporter substrate-binding protein [Chloroflexi bacterium]|nr:ABC transporter substrate-binding protein [Chloroflexota bacterium]